MGVDQTWHDQTGRFMELFGLGKPLDQLRTAADCHDAVFTNSNTAVFYSVILTPSGQQVSAGDDMVRLLVLPVDDVLSLPDAVG